MRIAVAETNTPDTTGAPIAKDAIDPDLVKLKRKRPKVGVVTAAGIAFLCGFFLVKLAPDRRFAGSGETPTKVTVADILADKVAPDSFIAVDAEPLIAHAIRTTQSKGNLGLRLVPVRGTGSRLWIVLSGDGWEPPNLPAHVGRLRSLDDLKFASAITEYAETHPRPVFATAAAVRAGLATSKVAAVGGEQVTLKDSDRVVFDVLDPDSAQVVVSLNDRLPDAAAWKAALAAAGLTPSAETPLVESRQIRFELKLPNAAPTVTTKLQAAELFGTRVDPVTHHHQTTWGALRDSAPTGFSIAGTTIPDAQIDLIGLYVSRDIPDGAYAVVVGEQPKDFWYILPITIGLALIGLVFAWALARAVRRDLMSPRAS